MNYQLHHGDNITLLATYPANHFDSIVTDPPYGLSFMGRAWDYDVPTEALWRECLRVLKPGGHLLAFGGSRTYHRMACRIEDAGFELRDQIMWLYGSGFPKNANCQLKPAHEPIVLARKPIAGSVASCVMRYGTGYLRIDECRIGTMTAGRWPANLIHDGSEEIMAAFPETVSGGPLKPYARQNTGGYSGPMPAVSNMVLERDEGSAARFFYCAKASPADREPGNTHPTVKPTELMRYLCRLVTPKGGLVLDPFCGSGSTGKATLLEGLRFVGMEREAEYVAIAESRLNKILPALAL